MLKYWNRCLLLAAVLPLAIAAQSCCHMGHHGDKGKCPKTACCAKQADCPKQGDCGKCPAAKDCSKPCDAQKSCPKK